MFYERFGRSSSLDFYVFLAQFKPTTHQITNNKTYIYLFLMINSHVKMLFYCCARNNNNGARK